MLLLFLIGLIVWSVWFSWRYAWWRPAVEYCRPRVLMYHMVKDPVRGARFNGLRVAPKMFERQLHWLKRNGWQTYTLSELIETGNNLPEKSVVLTFDDGFEDNFLNAFPLLKKYEFKATIYLVVDRHDRDWSVNKKKHHNDGELRAETKLKDDQIREMVASGLIEIGGHTVTHANFLKLSDNEKKQELEQSKNVLESSFGVDVKSFAYPFGLYQRGDIHLVSRSGYTSAVTTESGIDSFPFSDRYQLKRIKISGKDNFLAFMLRIRGGRRGLFK